MKYYRQLLNNRDPIDIARVKYFKKILEIEGLEGIILERMKQECNTRIYNCEPLNVPVERGCSNGCEFCKPRNGKSGRCKAYQNYFEGTGQYFKLTKKGLRKI